MPYRALIVGGAAGFDPTAAEVLQRMDFADTVLLPSIDDALAAIPHERFDILVVPLSDMHGAQLAMLDRALRRAGTTFVIGTATRPDPELILRALRSGIHEFLLLPLDAAEFGSAVERLLARHEPRARDGHVLAFYSGKGGVGTTTVAVNVAACLAALHKPGEVALADFVTGSGDVRLHLNLTPTYDRSDLLQKLDQIDNELLRSVLTPCADGLGVLPGPEAGELEPPLDATATRIIIDQFRQDLAFAVIDCERQLGDGTLAAFDASDRIVLVTELTVPSLRSTQRTLAVIRRLGQPDAKVAVVVNRQQSGEVLSPADAQEVLQREIFWRIPNDYRTAATAITNGQPAVRQDPRSKLAASYRQMTEKLGSPHLSPSRNGHHAGGAARIAKLFGRAQRRT